MDKLINAIVAIAAALTSIAETLKSGAKPGTVSSAPVSSPASEPADAVSAEDAQKKANQAAALKKAQEAKAAKVAAAKKAAADAAAAAVAAEGEGTEPAADEGLLGEETPAETEITQTTIRELGMKLLKADKDGSAKLQKILAKHGATNLTTLAKDKFKSVHDAVKALIKE